jgi:hypothetical protein
MGFPQVSYRWGIDAIRAQLADKLTNEMTIKLLNKNCPPSQIEDNFDLLLAFQEYNNIRQFDGLPVFPEFNGHFRVGPDVSVPINPTVLLREGGVIKPLFIIGWANNGLTYYQRRLLSSMYEDAIYSLTDLRASRGEVLIFPRNGYGKRTVERWYRDTYQLLSREELREQVERFIKARSAARPLIIKRFREREESMRRQTAARRGNPPHPPAPSA